MSSKPASSSYHPVAKLLHWSTALIVFGLLCLGAFMIDMPYGDQKFKLYGLHKSFGTIVLGLLVLRVLWRFLTPHPAKIESHKSWEVILSKLVHIALYLCLLALPLSGWIMSNAGGYPYSFFGLFEMPDLTGKNEVLKELSEDIHEISVFVLIGIITLHMAGAVKHAMIDRDITLRRMLPGFGYRSFASLFVVMGSAGLILSAGLLLRHELREMAEHNEQIGAVSNVQSSAAVAEEKIKEAVRQEDATNTLPAWVIIHDESKIGFAVKVQGEMFAGVFQDYDADIFFDPDNLSDSYAKFVVHTASVKTDDRERTGYIVMEPWLFSESFPESSYVIDSFSMEGHKFIAKGQFSIRGVQMPLEVPLDIQFEDMEAGQRRAIVSGGFRFNRLEHGIGQGSWEDSAMVDHNIKIDVHLVAETEK